MKKRHGRARDRGRRRRENEEKEEKEQKEQKEQKEEKEEKERKEKGALSNLPRHPCGHGSDKSPTDPDDQRPSHSPKENGSFTSPT